MPPLREIILTGSLIGPRLMRTTSANASVLLSHRHSWRLFH